MPDPVIYSIDTNVLMDWQARYYPTDVFTGIVTRVESIIAAGRWIAPALVHEETEAVGTDGLKAWAEAHKAMFRPVAETLADGLAIQGRFPGLRDPRAEYDEADAFVIALAQQRGGIVVTQETAAAEKARSRRSHYIPDVCRDLGIPCINLLGLMRREGWVLS
jgi:hypothetical protein